MEFLYCLLSVGQVARRLPGGFFGFIVALPFDEILHPGIPSALAYAGLQDSIYLVFFFTINQHRSGPRCGRTMFGGFLEW